MIPAILRIMSRPLGETAAGFFFVGCTNCNAAARVSQDPERFFTALAGGDVASYRSMASLLVLLLASPPSDCSVVALVTRVFDGDTVEAAGVGRVRLLGIDAPEIGGPFERPAPFAIEAREALRALVLHRWVRFECDGTRRDVYGRSLFYISLESGEFINATLVRIGMARVSVRTRLRRWDELRRAEEDAQSRRRGMWGERPRVPSPSYSQPRRK